MELFNLGRSRPSASDCCGYSLTSVGVAELENNITPDAHKFLLDISKLYQSSRLSKIRKVNPSKCIFKRNLPRWISCIFVLKHHYREAVYSAPCSVVKPREREACTRCVALLCHVISLGFVFLISIMWLLSRRPRHFLLVPICDSGRSHFSNASVSTGSWGLQFVVPWVSSAEMWGSGRKSFPSPVILVLRKWFNCWLLVF